LSGILKVVSIERDGIMPLYDLIATSTFGLESVVAEELRRLGYTGLTIENGRVSFRGDERDIARCNVWLRTADRLLVRMGDFVATDFGQLFDRTLEVPWQEFIPENGKMHVVGKSIRSTLFSVPDCQSIVKKAIVEAMKRKYHRGWFDESGPTYKIEVGLLKDHVTLTIDTTGAGLHKRGYRKEAGEAPIKETLAAALVLLSRWDPSRALADPFCGSGTIPTEAALIGKNMAPGMNRSFAAEEWPQIPRRVWAEVKDEARARVLSVPVRVLASDADGTILGIARKNARSAGVADCVTFRQLPVGNFSSEEKFGCIVCNPPYGERIGQAEQVEELYSSLGQLYARLDDWSMFVLSAHPLFERFFGSRPDRKRKLYNGRIECCFYQYFGPLPRKAR
jgi:putative N6-adenine-specific DNA methylase